MKTLVIMLKRNIKLFFKDKGMFFTSLITPAILLVLYATFLAKVYKDAFVSSLPVGFVLDEGIMNGLVGGQLISSLLAVSCITVAFCSNFLMVQDKANGTIKDLRIAPVKSSILSVSYYIASFTSTLIICLIATVICLVYIGIIGWYMSFVDVLLLVLDVVILSLFGTALSSVINYFLSTQGQISAVGSIVSSCYGFICGAYMPISSFATGLQKVISFLPGTYGTALVRNHAMNGVLKEMEKEGVPSQVVESIKDSIDCNIYFFDNKVDISSMYIILVVTVTLLVGGYIALNMVKKKQK